MITAKRMTGYKLGEKYDFVYQVFIHYGNFDEQFVFYIFCMLIKEQQNFISYTIESIYDNRGSSTV